MRILRKLFVVLVVTLLLAVLWVGWLWTSVAEEQVEFLSDDLLMQGTLLSPRWDDAVPGIVLVHGSGEVTRKSMLAFAWLFAIKGYAVIAYDKRGVGASEGEPHEWREFSFVDLAADATAAYKFLQTQPQIDGNRLGFFGASQGGWVVSLAANQVEAPAFAIMASASVSTVAEDRIFGREAQVRYAGFDEDAVVEASQLIQADHLVTRTSSDFVSYVQMWDTVKDRMWFDEVYGDTRPEPLNSAHRKWEKTILDFNPLPLLKSIDVPVLWICGDPALDRFSPISLSLQRVSAAHAAGACYRTIQIDDVGHTLEPENADGLLPLLKVRVPLVLDIYEWLDDIESQQVCDQ